MTLNPLLTLRAIQDSGMHDADWAAAARILGPDLDAPISLGDVAITSGAEDAIRCLRKLDWTDVAIRRAVIGAVILPACRHAQVHTTDPRVAACNDALARWCAGDDAVDLRGAATGAACAATYAADAIAVARAARAAYAAHAAHHAAHAALSTYTYPANGFVHASFASYATDAAALAAGFSAADPTERQRQRADIIAAFPPVRLARKESE